MNVDKKNTVQKSLFYLQLYHGRNYPFENTVRKSESLEQCENFLTDQILQYYSQIRTRFRELRFIGNCGNKTKIYKMTTSTLLKKLSKTLSLHSSRRCIFSSSKIYTKIEVFPKHSLADERLTSTILSDLKPFQKGEIFQNLYRIIFFVSLFKIIFQLY